MVCPSCGSDDTASVSDIYQTGKCEVYYQKPILYYMDGKEIFLGTVPEKDVMLLPLAQRLSPPSKPQYFGKILSPSQDAYNLFLRPFITLSFIIFIWTLLLDTSIFFLTTIANLSVNVGRIFWLGMLLMLLFVHIQLMVDIKQIRIYRRKMDEWELLMHKWKSSYYCRGCDRIFM